MHLYKESVQRPKKPQQKPQRTRLTKSGMRFLSGIEKPDCNENNLISSTIKTY